MEPLKNNHYCCTIDCDYETKQKSQLTVDADKQLIKDGGYNAEKKSLCPICQKDSLVFLT